MRYVFSAEPLEVRLRQRLEQALDRARGRIYGPGGARYAEAQAGVDPRIAARLAARRNLPVEALAAEAQARLEALADDMGRLQELEAEAAAVPVGEAGLAAVARICRELAALGP